MEIIETAMPIYAIAVSLLAIIPIGLSGERNPNLRESWTITAAILKFIIIVSMIPIVLDGKVIEYSLITVLPGIDVKFRVDALSLVFAVTASFLWIVTSIFSIGYMRALKEHSQTRYFAFFAAAMAATIGVAFSANLFTLFLFYEAITICTFPLVAHNETPDAIKGARRYIIYLLGTSLAFQLFAIILTYNIAGTLEFANHGILAGKASDLMLIIIFILFIAGITKAALMPLHSWLPAAMVAPTPVSAFLHAVAVVNVGVFTVLKVLLYIFGTGLLYRLGISTVFIYFVSFTIIVASIIALRQDNLKRMLAYSTVSQLSYIILGASLLGRNGITGGIIHIAIHSFAKITLFFAAGAIYVANHKTMISELNGMGRKMPFTMTAFAIASLSIIGIPPLSGFLSKWYLMIGSIESGHAPILIVLVASTLLNASYFLPVVYAAFFKKLPSDEKSEIREAPAFMIIPIMVTAVGTLLLFFAPSLLLDLAGIVLGNLTGGY